MTAWSPERILEASAAIDQAPPPPDVMEVATAQYRLVRFPDRYWSPTFGRAQVWSLGTGPFDGVIDEVGRRVRGWGLDEVCWWVDRATPPEHEAALLAREGELCDAYLLLACELTGGQPAEQATGVAVEVVHDQHTFRAAARVEVEGWRRRPPGDDAVAREYEQMLGDLEAGSEFRVLAYVDGEPAATGRCRLIGDVGRLSGAVTLPAARRRGAYRAVLAHRMQGARQRGATLALTRGRPSTSGPILIEAGFREYDVERCYRLAAG